MKLLKKMNLIFPLVLVGCLLFSIAPAARGFVPLVRWGMWFDVLVRKVHKAEWVIGYRYGPECKPEERRNGKALEAAITKTLRAWLQPLRELPLQQPLTDVFRYQLQEDVKEGDDQSEGRRRVDLRIAFECGEAATGISVAKIGALPPDVYMRSGTRVDQGFILTHELGHAFGMSDTYKVDQAGGRSSGGLRATMGTQPPAVMSSHFSRKPHPYLSVDDKKGIIWLYKAFHGGLEGPAAEDCFFPDYVFEPETRGCRPKYPLIFEVKHGHPKYAVQMLDEDPKLDVNAQNDAGFTALHYAVMHEQTEVVKRLLAHEGIKPFLRDKGGRSALKIAREEKFTGMVELLLAHPLTLSVNPARTLTSTWGALKIAR